MKEKKSLGFFSKMSNPQQLEYVAERFNGYSISEFESKDGTACNYVRKRRLLDTLVEKGVLKRLVRNGLSKLTDNELIELVKREYQGLEIGKFERESGRVCALIRERNLLGVLEQNNILIRRKRFKPFEGMTNADIKRYAKRNYEGNSISEIQELDSTFYKEVQKRKILDDLVKERIIVRIKLGPIFSKMSDTELKEYVRANHKGQNIKTLQQEKHGSALHHNLLKRDMVEQLIEEDILRRARTKSGTYSKMSDVELCEYISSKYQGKTINQLQRSSEPRLYQLILEKGLVDKLVKQGALIRENRGSTFFAEMNNEQLIIFVREKYNGLTIGTFQKEDGTAYNHVKKRGLLDQLLESGVIVRGARKKGYFSEMSDDALCKYVKGYCKGYTISQLQKSKDASILTHLRERGLLDGLVRDGILINKMISKSISVLETLLEGGVQ